MDAYLPQTDPRITFRRLAMEHIDEQIRQLKVRRSDISIEVMDLQNREQSREKWRNVAESIKREGR